jgi:sec-independent protein translocase protein TatB
MFDFSFSELALCFLVALVVLGPERLPPIARSLGRWTGQARSYLRHLSSELERETNAAELKKQLQEARQALREGTQAAQNEFKSVAAEADPRPKPASADAPSQAGESSGGPLP